MREYGNEKEQALLAVELRDWLARVNKVQPLKISEQLISFFSFITARCYDFQTVYPVTYPPNYHVLKHT